MAGFVYTKNIWGCKTLFKLEICVWTQVLLWEVLVESGASLSEPAHTELFELSILLSSVELLACEPEWYLNTINGKCCWGSPSTRLGAGISWQSTSQCWQTDSSSIIKPLVRLNIASFCSALNIRQQTLYSLRVLDLWPVVTLALASELLHWSCV